MSVYSDFQKMWGSRYGSLSNFVEWDQDVRASLQKHREKIDELTKELEEERQYCEYLERLLKEKSAVCMGGDDDQHNDVEKNDDSKENTVPDDSEKSGTSTPQPTTTDEKEKDENLVQLRKDGALNQCINELSSNFRRCISEIPENTTKNNNSLEKTPMRSRRNSQGDILAGNEQPSHFVTVIEVRENIDEKEKFTTDNNSEHIPKVSAVLAAIQDGKKKIPPRPPPKFIRRAAPVDPPMVPTSAKKEIISSDTSKSPSSSLERNVKPSEILRQRSSDSLDVKLGFNRKHLGSIGNKSSELADEFTKKHESLEKKQQQNIKASPTGSLTKTNRSNDSPTGSLSKVSELVGASKESLTSHPGGSTSEIIKSYESISSLSSDGKHGSGNILENEPFYDTVPIDNIEGDYVYIQAGGNGSTSSRDDISSASTLPLPIRNSQNSVILEPESPGRSSNYVNIDYFLQHNNEARSSSIDSDGEHEPPPALMRHISHDEHNYTPNPLRKLSTGANRSTRIRHIITSIMNSETLYVDCLNKMVQYMKAIRATLTTSQPVILEEEFETMFYKIEELHKVHTLFLNSLKEKLIYKEGGGDIYIGETFKILADHISLYGAFLHNYQRAIDTVKSCGAHSQQFKEIVADIKLDSKNEQSLSLEDLLHKPVARVQKNALVLQDLLNETPEQHVDYPTLKQAQKTIRNLLSEFNVIQTKGIFPSDDKALRRLVKNSFIVELADGHRKLRHLFLFNDVIACAKYKASGRDRFEFELKWFISLKDIFIIEDPTNDPKENNPVNILQLKSQACTVRDQIMLEEKDDKKRAGDKHRKKLSDLEAQLVLASPNLVFRIRNKGSNKTMTFFLSSEFERSQWIESILTLQKSCNLPGQIPVVTIYELEAWIEACQKIIKTEMGSYLMRNSRDESLLIGDLHLTVQGLTGLDIPADLFICIEIDSYGHYFRKAKTKVVYGNSSPLWNEAFVVELEGSQNLRILLYEEQTQRPKLRAKHVIKLSRKWLEEVTKNIEIKMSESISINTSMKFTPGEVSLRRVPTSKPGALFGTKMQQVLKREKRDVPFIISACIREVERRGLSEVGVYRVSGSASDLARLKKSFETNPYEAEQLLKEVDIHSVTGILKSYLRDLPEALFTDQSYQKFFDTFNKFSSLNENQRIRELQTIFNELPMPNRVTINLILDHLIRINQQESENKMSLHNLAMVFGPTLMRPGPQPIKHKELLESSTVDVMAQAGILYCFLQAKLPK